MANVDNPSGFQAVQVLGGGAVPIWEGTTASNVTLAAGDALIIATTGLINIWSGAAAQILGVATEAVTGATGVRKTVHFAPALPNIVFSGQCSGTAAITDLFEAVDIEGTTGIMELNEDANTYGLAWPVALEQGLKNAWGANARLLFIWAKTAFTNQA